MINKRKYIFFDIDGTLSIEGQGLSSIPLSTIHTIQKLQENGHIVGIASGRQLATILEYSTYLDIDYIVSDGGYGVTINNNIIHIDPLEKEIAIPLCEELANKHIPYAIMLNSTDEILYASRQMMEGREEMYFEGIPVKVIEDFDYHLYPIYKVFMKIGIGQEKIISSFDLTRINRYEEDGLVVEPDDKYKGVQEIVEYFQGNKEDIIYFGDGYNDLNIFDQVKYSIAMGNGIEELKEKAYFVTKALWEDGIEYACKELELIEDGDQ